MIAIIDYGAGNLQSVKKALDFLGYENVVTSDSAVIDAASHVILPGVGSFGDAMDSIRSRGLEDTIRRAADGSKPFLGICLGLQLLFEKSDESPDVRGLGIFDGSITLLPKDAGLKVPHMGWNSLKITQSGGIFDGIDEGTYFYFVHSYYLGNADSDVVAATTEYGAHIQCAVQSGKVAATQFHPEKSGKAGLRLLKNFVREV